jgi:hypothetical protein
MLNPNTPALPLTPQISAPDKSKLTKLQQEFNDKTKQIERLKQQITSRKASIDIAQNRFDKELKPFILQIVEQRVEIVKLLDEAYSFPFFKRNETDKLSDLIVSITHELIARHNRKDMLKYYNKYAEVPYGEGVDYTVEDFDTQPDEPFENAADVVDAFESKDDFEDYQAQLDWENEQRERQKQNRQKNRKTKAQQAKEAQAKAELNNISKASRRVYTELAKQLHPDKELDENARLWKEEAMKKVTQAYHNDDFFELLRLQMEFLQEQALHRLPEDQLNYYVQILNDQVNDLKDELHNFSSGNDADFYNRFCGTPKQMNQKFKQAKDDLAYELQNLKINFRNLQDPQEVRMMLKELR